MKSGLGRLAGLLLIGAASLALASCQKPTDASLGAASSGGRILLSDERGDAVVVVDPGTGAVIKTIAVGKRPRGILLSPDGTRLYVALSGTAVGGAPDRTEDGIGVIDLADFGMGARITAGADPETFAISADGQTLFVSNQAAGELSIVALDSGDILAHIKVGDQPEGVAATPDGKTVLVACGGANAVYVVDIATSKVKAIIKMDGRPRAIALTRDGSAAYISNENSGHITVIDVTKNSIRTVIAIPDGGPGAAPPEPMGLVFSPDQAKLYASTGRGGAVAEIDTATNTVGRMIKNVGARPWGITVSADGKHLYTANGPSGDISVIDTTTGAVEKKIKVGQSPWGIAFSKAP
ncbi:MAG: beta-propeller repeat protein [Caulobacteraceae bacterium]|nr:beta-propeller repeat protein [Caulobacteraceae bacterium]